ncbi:SET domain-containing protein [Penicillium argentinense]|uniref:SET domain-containing protein n=1 Tax=Penicillium argentinense TaxID=1131581 RepID=A0A9W9FG51_9EURO|nr:SET domain-containing protein [Penicillium argentinense]KAJ5099475.1 SET domain-containing protein [Penicillium argentinense]
MEGQPVAKHSQPNLQQMDLVDRCNEIISAIFWDLNAACQMPLIVQGKPEGIDWQYYEIMKNSTQAFIDQTFMALVECESNPANASRHIQALDILSWKIYTICAHAEAFRRLFETETDEIWDKVLELVKAEERSVEVFACTRGLEWRGPLLTKASDREWPHLQEALAPEINTAVFHPHQVVQTQDGYLRLATFEGHVQANISESFHNAKNFPEGKYLRLRDADTYPLLREPKWGPCALCGSLERCNCQPVFLAGDLVELREYPGKGIGTRTLTNLQPDTWIGNFVGELFPTSHREGYWSFAGTFCPPGRTRRLQDYKANINPERFGNWTRFANHHCEENTHAGSFLAGGRANIAFKVDQKINAFDEVLINYGRGYWQGAGRKCLCGSKNCVSKR